MWKAILRRPLLAAAVVIPTAIFLAAAAFDYSAERKEAEGQVLTTATALSEHAEKVFETTDLAIARVLDRINGMSPDEITSSAELHSFLTQLCAELPQFESMFILSADGFNLATTRAFPVPAGVDLSRREYFQQARNGLRGAYVSNPFKPALNDRVIFTVTWPRLQQGRFAGVVGISISPSYFREFYREATDYPGLSTATIVREDGAVLFRYPQLQQPLLQLPLSSALMGSIRTGQTRGSFAGYSVIDGRARIGAFRRLTSVPVYVSFTIPDRVFLASWGFNMLFVAAFCTALSLALLVTERSLTRRAAAELRATHQLAEEIDRRRKAELALEQMQKMEALGRLTGGVAHDFNNLLTAILGPLELASKRITDARVLRLLGTATQAAQRGARLTAQMLAFARKREATVGLVDPNTVIRGMTDIIARTLEPSVRVTYELDPAATPVAADQVQLEVTLLNLCGNARDAMPDGGEVTVRTCLVHLAAATPDQPELAPGDYVQLSVSDNGEGMSEAVRARAMEPFFTTKPPGKGTGLGLSTAYGLGRSAGGAVSIDSMPGRGTTVAILLAKREGAGVIEANPPPFAPPSSRRRILLVDDDEVVRTIVHELLEDLGHSVTSVEFGQAAIRILQTPAVFDLLMTDYAMPVMTGDDLAQAVRILRPKLPILFITGHVDDGALADWHERDAVTLQKPFTSSELAQAVESAVSRVARAGQPA